MIAYRLLRALGKLALRWFYRDTEVIGLERIPARGPALLASNHPNALVDALVIGCTLRRPVTLTAKATLLRNPLTRGLLRIVGVVPLQRASDAAHSGAGAALDPARNADSFAAVLDVLDAGGLVLLFPEGKSHSDPELAPLKTGLARIAVMAHRDRRCGAPIIPIGLTFERKWQPRSRILIHIGMPIVASDGIPNVFDPVANLTRRVDAALREVTLNFRTSAEERRVLSVSTTLAEILDDFRPLGTPDPPLATTVRLSHRLNEIAPTLPTLALDVGHRVERFIDRLSAFEALTKENHVAVSDVQMNHGIGPGAWFIVRELSIAAVAGPFALWGRVNHLIPIRIARLAGLKTSQTLDEPATNTIVAGLFLVLAFYAIQIGLVAVWLGGIAAAVYAVSLPLSATWDFRYADRVRRGVVRVRTYLRFRRGPELHRRLAVDLTWLRAEAMALNALLGRASTDDSASTLSHG